MNSAKITPATPEEIKAAIRNIPDFPQPGIQFKDITPVLQDPRLFASSIELLIGDLKPGMVDAVVGDCTLVVSYLLLVLLSNFMPVLSLSVKRANSLTKHDELTYNLEYGTNTIAIHVDALKPGARVLLVDDLLATGGTAAAAAELVKQLGAQILEIAFLIELTYLGGREKLRDYPVRTVIAF